jgi:gluconolactonase
VQEIHFPSKPQQVVLALTGLLLFGCTDSMASADDAPLAAVVDAGAAPIPPSVPANPVRTRICGSATAWPAPLPEAADKRTATRLSPEGTSGSKASFKFIEGPVWIAERGVLLFSDMDFGGGDTLGPPAKIWRLTPRASAPPAVDTFVAAVGSNGLALMPDGSLIAATHDTRSLSLFDLASGKRSDLTVRYQGKRFSSPNDLAVRSDGTVYFTDPDWQLGPKRTKEIPQTSAYRIKPPVRAGQPLEALPFEQGLDKPNGIALSPDERTLYLGSSGQEVWKYDVNPDGSLTNKREFAKTGASDGMTVDCAGNLYVASGTVEVFAPSGQKLGELRTGEEPANVAFGGLDRKTLYITARTGLFAITLNVPGYPY